MRDLVEELTCPICQEEFDNPRLLPCHHCYCKRCIDRVAAAAGTGKEVLFLCPECRTRTLLPEGGADQLAPAFLVNRVKERVDKARDRVPALARDADKPSSPPAKLAVASSAYVCNRHESVLKWYCFDCQKLICAECALVNHSGHRYRLIRESAYECRDAIRQAVVSLVSIREKSAAAVEQVEVKKDEISKQGVSLTTYINKSFDGIIAVVEQRRGALLTRLQELVESKTGLLNEQKKTLGLASDNMNQLCAMVETLLDVPDEEFMNSQQQLLSLVEKEALTHDPSTLQPCEMADIVAEVTCVGDIYDICQSKALVYAPLAYGSGISAPEVNTRAEFTIRPALPRNQEVSASLVSAANGIVVPVTVNEKNGAANCYVASYLPKVRGRYQLAVSVKGEPPQPSISVFVRAPPTPEARLFTACTGLRGPAHVGFTASGQVVVSERIGNRVALRYRNQCSLLELNFDQPCGVTVDQNDNIYVSETQRRRLSKFDKTGKLIISLSGENDLIVAPAGIKMIRNDLYVSDAGSVQVFDQNLNFTNSISARLGMGVADITSSPGGYLYVAETEPPMIHVFTVGHTYLHSIQHADLRSPSGVCFDVHQQLLYVCDSAVGCVFVFRHDGEYVMKMTIEGGRSNQMRAPTGITLDKDGYLYVCDTGNNRVVVL